MIFLLAFIFLFTHTTWGQTVGKNAEFNSVSGADYYTNFVINESAKKNAANTVTSNATVARGTTNKIDNVASFTVDASALNGYVEFTLGTIYDPATSGNCEFKGVFKGDGTLYKAQIVDGSGNLLNQTPVLTNETNWRAFSVTYPCAASGSRKVRITQTESGTAPAFSVGKLYYGQITNLQAGVPNNVFSAIISSAGVVSGENEDFINGNCSYSSPYYICTYVASKFTQRPSCTVQMTTGSGSYYAPFVNIGGSSSTQLQYGFRDSSGNPVQVTHDISCTRSGTDSIQSAITPAIPSAPTVKKFTSGSGTYATPVGVKYIRVRMVGGGGGGSGSALRSSNNGGTGGSGGTTTFGSSLLTANGGSGALGYTSAGSGGTASISLPAYGTAFAGANTNAGHYGSSGATIAAGPKGADSYYGGGGAGGEAISPGNAAKANSGSGGGGAGQCSGDCVAGSGGAAGGFVDAIIPSPSSTYSYSVGAGGTAGTAGTSGYAGGAGGSGYIEVTEYYGSENAPMLVGSVTSDYTGALSSVSLRFGGSANDGSICNSSPCTIWHNYGNVSSVTRSGTGTYSAVFQKAFSTRPVCTCAGIESGVSYRLCIPDATTTSVTVICQSTESTPVARDCNVQVTCIGPR